MREYLNWYEVQQLVRVVVDKPSYLLFRKEMTARFKDLSQQIVEAKAIMTEAQRIAAEENTKQSRVNMSIAQNHRRILRIRAQVIHAALHTAKEHARKLAQTQ